jgi:hypothetical protein
MPKRKHKGPPICQRCHKFFTPNDKIAMGLTHCKDCIVKECVASASTHVETVSHDPVNHPTHYNQVRLQDGRKVECIEIIEALQLGFHLGNALKYLWRHDNKGNRLEELQKARWYLDREIQNEEEFMRSAPKSSFESAFDKD